jgi:hypothetical protein
MRERIETFEISICVGIKTLPLPQTEYSVLLSVNSVWGKMVVFVVRIVGTSPLDGQNAEI